VEGAPKKRQEGVSKRKPEPLRRSSPMPGATVEVTVAAWGAAAELCAAIRSGRRRWRSPRICGGGGREAGAPLASS